MNGENESLATWGKNQIQKLNNLLDEYNTKVGLPKNNNSYEDVEAYLNMSKKQLEGLSGEECAVISAYLSMYSLYIQRENNREVAKTRWAESNLKLLISKEIVGVPGYSYEERRMQVVRENVAALSLEKLRMLAESRVNELNYISTKIEFICKSLGNLERAKTRT